MEKRERDVAWDEDAWVDVPSLGTVSYLSGETRPDDPCVLVPDGAGDYREHRVSARPKRRLGF